MTQDQSFLVAVLSVLAPILAGAFGFLFRWLAGHLDSVTEQLAEMRQEIAVERDAAELVRGILEAAPDAILVVGERGLIEVINRQTEVMFGYLRADLVGQPIERLIPNRFWTHHIADRAVYLSDPHTRVMGSGLELYAQRQDGTEFRVQVSLSPLSNGGHTKVIAIARELGIPPPSLRSHGIVAVASPSASAIA